MTDEPDGTGKVHLALVAVQGLFAVHYVVAKLLLADVPAPAWAALRVGAAALVFLALFHARRARMPGLRDQWELARCAALGIVINQICFVEGLARTTASHSALINTTIPVATALFAVLLGREAARPRVLAGIGVAFLGVLVLLRVDDLESGSRWLAGDLLTQANALSFSLFLVVSRSTVRRLGPMASTTGFLLWGTLGVAAYGGGAVAKLDPAVWTLRNIALAGYVVLGATVATYLLNAWALARVESSRVALFIYLQPVMAAGLAAIWLDEEITVRFVVSAVLVFAGVLLATTRGRPAPA